MRGICGGVRPCAKQKGGGGADRRGDGPLPFLQQGKPFDQAQGKRSADPTRATQEGHNLSCPYKGVGGGLVVDVGFGFELGEHGLEERLVGVGSAGNRQLQFLGRDCVIACVRREAGLRQMA